MRAELCGVPVLTMENAEASSLGAAMAAAVASNDCADWREAAASMVRVSSRVTPTTATVSSAQEIFGRWQQVWERP